MVAAQRGPIIRCGWIEFMANPAELLLGIFSKWDEARGNGASAQESRADTDSLDDHRLAIGYLNQIDELLNKMALDDKRVGPYRRQFPVWVKHTFNYGEVWTHADPGTPAHAFDVLEGLIDALAPYVPALESERFEELKEYLHKVRDTLNEDTSISRGTLQGALALVENVLTLIDSYTVVGDFELERALQSLLGSLAWAAAQSTNRERWRDILTGFFIPYSVNQVPGFEIPSVPRLLELVQGG